MVNDKILRDYVMKNEEVGDIVHSSGYAQAQSGNNIGTAGGSGLSIAKRRALDDQRQFAGGYRDSALMRGVHGDRHAKAYTGEVKRNYGRSEAPAKRGYGRTEGGGQKTGYGRTEGTPQRTGYGRSKGGSIGAGGMGAPSARPPERKVGGINLPKR